MKYQIRIPAPTKLSGSKTKTLWIEATNGWKKDYPITNETGYDIEVPDNMIWKYNPNPNEDITFIVYLETKRGQFS
jgi:hypothetical protein